MTYAECKLPLYILLAPRYSQRIYCDLTPFLFFPFSRFHSHTPLHPHTVHQAAAPPPPPLLVRSPDDSQRENAALFHVGQ